MFCLNLICQICPLCRARSYLRHFMPHFTPEIGCDALTTSTAAGSASNGVHCPYKNTLTVGYRVHHRKNKAYFIILLELKIFCLDMWAAPSRVVCPSLFWSCILLCWGRRSREDWVETQLLYSRPALTVINQWHWNGCFVANVGFLSSKS